MKPSKHRNINDFEPQAQAPEVDCPSGEAAEEISAEQFEFFQREADKARSDVEEYLLSQMQADNGLLYR